VRSSAAAEITRRFDIVGPIFREESRAHVSMDPGIRPIVDPGDQMMPDRIDMAMFDMACVVSFIADQMLPESALPDTALARALCEGR
jgi:hypothetical protein